MTPGFLRTAPVPHLGFESVRIPSRGNCSGSASDRHLYLLILKVMLAKQEHYTPCWDKRDPQ